MTDKAALLGEVIAKGLVVAKKTNPPQPMRGAREVSSTLSSTLVEYAALLHITHSIEELIRTETVAAQNQAKRPWARTALYRSEEALIQMEASEEMAAGLLDLVTSYASQLVVDWQRVVGAAISNLDGQGGHVLWGEASIELHEARAAMHMKNVRGNAESAAMHMRAAQELRAAGVDNINALLRKG